MMIHRGPWIQTYRGLQFFPLSFLGPREDEIDIEDIAHALSLQCRFSGHCKRHYSVAEHSIHVMRCVPQEYKLWALLHDAPEAYILDIPRPLKQIMPEYREVESRIMRAICRKFGLSEEMPDIVHDWDITMLATEAHFLMSEPPAPWELPVPPYLSEPIIPMEDQDPRRWEYEFLTQFHLLCPERAQEGGANG